MSSMLGGILGAGGENETRGRMAIEEQKMLSRQATLLIIKSRQEQEDMRRQLEELKGEQQAKYAASGVKTTEGSPMDVMIATERMGQEAIFERGLWAHIEAAFMKKAGRLIKRAATMSNITSAFSFGMNAAGQIGQMVSNMQGGAGNEYQGTNLLG